MAKLRPAKCYRRKKRPWTRISKKKPRKSYVKGVPNTKIRRYMTGTRQEYEKKYFLICDSTLQLRDNSIEAARVAMSNYIQKNIKLNFYLILRKYPFNILREHKQAAVAGADRFFSGMKHAFGRPCGQGIYTNKKDVLFELWIDEKDEEFAKKAFKMAKAKLSGKYIITNETVCKKPKE